MITQPIEPSSRTTLVDNSSHKTILKKANLKKANDSENTSK